jgi:TolB protein
MRVRRSSLPHALTVLALLLATSAEVAHAAERPIIEVTPGDERAFHAAVQTFIDTSAGAMPERAGRLRTAVEEGLDFNGVLLPLAREAFLAPQETTELVDRRLDCPDWRQSGADALVDGEIRIRDGALEVEYRVWDVARCVRLQKATLIRPASEIRSLGTALSDGIVEAFTGTPGAASTEIAFISTRTGHREVFVMDADGSNSRPATNSDVIKAFPEWTPNGDGVLYTTYLRGGIQDLYLTSRGPKRAGRILRDTLPGAPKYRGVFRPDGQEIAVVASIDGAADLFRVGRNGRDIVRLTNNAPVIDISPSWSPDSSQIAFASDRTGSPQIYVMDSDGQNTRRLTYQSSYSSAPAWSPDGRWIAYGVRTEGQFDLYLTDPSGEVTIPLVVHRGNDQTPSWSPDGRKIVFSSDRRGRADLYVIDVNSGRLRRVTSNVKDNIAPDWGPFLARK